MVRAGAVTHPAQWEHGGYREIQSPRSRRRIIDLAELSRLCGHSDMAAFQAEHRDWVETALRESGARQDAIWTESLAMGSENYIARVKQALGLRASHREMVASGDGHILRESQPPYVLDSDIEKPALRPKTRFHGTNLMNPQRLGRVRPKTPSPCHVCKRPQNPCR
jgi:putative transposase